MHVKLLLTICKVFLIPLYFLRLTGNMLNAVLTELLLFLPSKCDVNVMLVHIDTIPFNTCLSLGVSMQSKESSLILAIQSLTASFAT